MPFPEEYLERIKKRIAVISPSDLENDEKLKKVIELFEISICGSTVGEQVLPTITDEFYDISPINIKNLNSCQIGINKGLTGVAFKLI